MVLSLPRVHEAIGSFSVFVCVCERLRFLRLDHGGDPVNETPLQREIREYWERRYAPTLSPREQLLGAVMIALMVAALIGCLEWMKSHG